MSDPGTNPVSAPVPDLGDPATYRPLLESAFVIDQDAGPVELRLVRVDEERVSGGFGQFSIFFHGPASRLLPQGIHALRHQTLGTIELFLVPVVGSNRERILYEACFSRLVPTGR
jgi:hypothetical protein